MDDIIEFEEMEKPFSPFSILDSVSYVFSNYGWHLLILAVVLTILYNKFLKSYLEKYKAYKFEQEYSAKYHKNPDVFVAHVSAQQAWAQKMQEKYNKEAEEHQRKMKEREEKKRQEFIEKHGSDSGFKLGSKSESDDSNKRNNLRPDYNPLMGAGNGSSYRPPRRSPCGGGGCGR